MDLPRKNLPQGKLPIEALEPILNLIEKGNLVVPPTVGVDVGITRTRGKYLVSSSDPITGTDTRMGWHAVNVSANDVATSGIMPDTLNVVSLFPESTGLRNIKSLMAEINATASALDIKVAGGHTEITPGLKHPIIVVTAFGSGSRFVTSGGAKTGDSIIMTKTAGLEGTSILCRLPKTKKIAGPEVCKRGERLIEQLSIIPEARTAFATGAVHGMHDVTEGGILGAVLEMSTASGLGFQLNKESIPIHESTSFVCRTLKLDPMKLIGSGSLLIACASSDEQKVMRVLSSKGIKHTKIGRFASIKEGRVVYSNGKGRRLNSPSIEDELWRGLREYGNLS